MTATLDEDHERTQRLAVLGSLVAGLAHEIRTPLAAATNHLSLIQKRVAGPLPPELGDVPGHAAALADALDRIDDLVERLRPFAKAAPGRGIAPQSLDEIAQEALDIFLVANPTSIATLGDLGGTPPVPVDRLLLEHAVLRLVERVAEHSRECVRISTRETPLAVELLIEASARSGPLATSDAAVRAARRIVEGQGGALSTRAGAGAASRFLVLSLPKGAPAPLTEARVA